MCDCANGFMARMPRRWIEYYRDREEDEWVFLHTRANGGDPVFRAQCSTSKKRSQLCKGTDTAETSERANYQR